jgi:hypothetical protein
MDYQLKLQVFELIIFEIQKFDHLKSINSVGETEVKLAG